MSRTRVYLSLGSNLGDRRRNLGKAVEGLRSFLEELRCSSIYETLPLYVADQPKFLNIAATGFTLLAPRALLTRILEIEALMGRRRHASLPKGPRPIDIDILLYGDLILGERDLTVPHPAMKERRFVLEPLHELDPGLIDPLTGQPFSLFLGQTKDQGVYIVSTWGYTQAEPEHDRRHPGRETELQT